VKFSVTVITGACTYPEKICKNVIISSYADRFKIPRNCLEFLQFYFSYSFHMRCLHGIII